MTESPVYETLIDANSLSKLLDAPGPAGVVAVDCRFSLTDPDYGRTAYAEGHLMGAYYADLDCDLAREPAPGDGRHPLPEPRAFARVLGRFGIGLETQVVVYDDVAGGIAGRLWWMLRHWFGHRRVAVLDGGFQAWLGAGFDVTAEVPTPKQGRYAVSPRAKAIVGVEEMIRIGASATDRAESEHIVIDARTYERFIGAKEPIDPVAGHIPGSINHPLGENLDANGCFREPHVLRKQFEQLGVASPAQVVHSCGSGVSACHNLLAMEVAGLLGSRLYVGSFSEWIRDPARSVATGDGAGS